MVKLRMPRKAQTVLGPIEASDLGITLPHEHLIADQTDAFLEPAKAYERKMARELITLENRWWVAAHHLSNIDNLAFYDEELITREVMHYKRAGGNSIVCMSNKGLGRDPQALARISRATGLHVIMGSGYYTANTHPQDIDDKKQESITDEIVRDISSGVDDTGIRAGIIGEVGCSWHLNDNEHKILLAAAKAQRLTGAPLNIHPGRDAKAPMQIIGILDKAGADISRTVMSHIERTLRNPEDRLKLAQTGCYLEYDHFGFESYFQRELAMVDMPNDHQRVNEIIQLIERGYIKHILISMDICLKFRLRSCGGHGYDHILQNVVPLMRAKGMTAEQIETIMVDNPKRLLQFV